MIILINFINLRKTAKMWNKTARGTRRHIIGDIGLGIRREENNVNEKQGVVQCVHTYLSGNL